MSISWLIVSSIFLVALQGAVSGGKNVPTIVFVSSKHTGTDQPLIKKLRSNIFQYTPPQPAPNFPFLPKTFPNFRDPFFGYSDVTLNNRITEIEHRLRLLQDRLAVLDNFLHCANITMPPHCSGLHPSPVEPENESMPTAIPTDTPINNVYSSSSSSSHSTSSYTDGSGGVVVTSSYNKPAGEEGQSSYTVEHFTHKPTI